MKKISGCLSRFSPRLEHSRPAERFRAGAMLTWALLTLICVVPAAAAESGQVTGNVSADGKAVAAALVVAVSSSSGQMKSALTNSEGHYSLSLSPGSYLLTVVHSVYVVDDGGFGCKLAESMNQTSVTIDFSLTRGGVISGTVNDTQGQPLVGRKVFFEIENKPFTKPCLMAGQDDLRTNDHGEFRIFGLPAGAYRIGIGSVERGDIGKTWGPFRTTYYPGVTDKAAAKVVEVSAGQDTTLPKFTVLTSRRTFSAEIKSVDDDTGDLLPSIEFDVAAIVNGRVANKTSISTEASGSININHLDPGQYKILSAVRNSESPRRDCSEARFEIVDRDLKDIVLRCGAAGRSISGRITINKTSAATDFDCVIALKEGTDLLGRDSPTYGVKLDPRGSFTVNGLRRSTYTLVIMPIKPSLQYEYAEIDGQLFHDRQIFGSLTIDLRAGPKSVVINLIRQ